MLLCTVHINTIWYCVSFHYFCSLFVSTGRFVVYCIERPNLFLICSEFMQPAVQKLQAVLAEVQFRTPRVPVISNVDAKSHSDPQEIKDILAKQVTSPVQWETIVTTMVKSPDFTKAYEFGPGEVL